MLLRNRSRIIGDCFRMGGMSGSGARAMRAAGGRRWGPAPLAAARPGRWAERSGSPPCRDRGGRPGEGLRTAAGAPPGGAPLIP